MTTSPSLPLYSPLLTFTLYRGVVDVCQIAEMSASTLRMSHDQRKKELLNELNIVLKAAASHRRSNKEPLAAELTANVCSVVEAVLIHGLRDPFFLRGSRYAKYPEPNFWPFVSKFTPRSVITQVQALNLIKTEIGKSRFWALPITGAEGDKSKDSKEKERRAIARKGMTFNRRLRKRRSNDQRFERKRADESVAWVRIVLNEGGLEHYLGVLGDEKKALGQFYSEDAFIRDGERVVILKDLLKSLNGVTITAPTNSSLLNTWTPSPLILAGLVDGKPLRVGAILHRRISSKEDSTAAETGICALELFSSSEVPTGSSPASTVASSPSPQSMLFMRAGLQKPSPRGKFEEGDDNSSVYSHPSMVTESRAANGVRAAGGYMEEFAVSSDGLVQRRTKRRRNMSKSSSDGSGSGRMRKAAAAASGAASSLPQLTRPTPPTAAAAVAKSASEPVRVKEDSLDGETEARRRRRENSGERRDSGVESEVNNASVSGCPTISSSNEETEEKEEQKRDEKEEETEEPYSSHHVDDETETMFEMSGDAETLKEMEGRGEEDREQGSTELPGGEERSKLHSDEYAEEEEMASTSSSTAALLSSLQQQQQQLAEDEGVASLSGNSLQGRSWRHAQRYASSLAGSSIAPADTPSSSEQAMMMMDESFEGAEMAFSPSDPTPLSTSSDTDGSLPAAVSFGAALRQHVVQQAGGTDVLIRKRDFSDSTEDGEDDVEDEEATLARKEAEEQETMRKLTVIATESGLDAQEFRCIMCKSTIGTPSYRAYSVCALDGRYYCSECWQQGAERVVPSRMITSWDVRVRKVSPRSRVFLDSIADKPMLHMDKANPSIYAHSAAMKEVKDLREKLQLVAMYLFNCRESVAADLRRRLAPREYFIDDVHLYSYNDLLTVVSGSMARQLKIMLKYAIGHVFDCALCSQKGFHCEMCNDRTVIYPFQTDLTHRCGECYAVSHIACFEKTHECVKCERRRKYSATRQATHLEIDC
ncbi:cup-14 [Pristionchus pacificus]|uniref:RUN domain-containing protein n=1 Tax=Pristionchus pacificus TaxID=54126 RepID=A0A2A6CWH7_PRIPA|nr:cup-14 [Pristionchus pacificus]|eukprot:PDM82545.1 hypothetical protein PRIPAC_36938 [Pristionchus pacificus]